jgi:hypothetical protein
MAEDKTREQLIDELAQARKAIGDVADHINNALTAVLGNISLAGIYLDNGLQGPGLEGISLRAFQTGASLVTKSQHQVIWWLVLTHKSCSAHGLKCSRIWR